MPALITITTAMLPVSRPSSSQLSGFSGRSQPAQVSTLPPLVAATHKATKGDIAVSCLLLSMKAVLVIIGIPRDTKNAMLGYFRLV